MKLVFCGYRSWSEKILKDLQRYFCEEFLCVTSKDELVEVCKTHSGCLIVLAGWSWYIEPAVLQNNTVVGLHPSNLPEYAGGSPIQNQVIDGVQSTKMTLYELNEEYDKGDIIAKCDLNLSGGVSDIFESLRLSGSYLLINFLSAYPVYEKHSQVGDGIAKKRLKPRDSELTLEKFERMTALQMYNFIRCREDPYPNVYVKDDTGTLLLKGVEFRYDRK